jgi:hypothetical protein
MTFIKAFAIGTIAVLVLEVALTFVLNIVGLGQHWASFRLAIGPVDLYTFERTQHGFSVSTGSGLLVVAILAGLLNGVGAVILVRSAALEER